MFQFLPTLFFAGLLSVLPLEASSENVHTHFTKVAKEGIPAVVSIRVEGEAPPTPTAPPEDPFGFFEDEFFRRFFGIPPRGNSQEKGPSIGQGSGFIVSPDGFILTNHHVVKNAKKITVSLNDEREYSAEVIGNDIGTDLAVIKIKASNLPYLDLGNSDALEVGEWVVAIGNPLGFQATLTVGVVSAKGRQLTSKVNTFEDFIQTDAAINRGNSGGPLLNLAGKVIGINTAIYSSTGGYMGIGFAIPSNMAKEIMDQLIETGTVTRGFLGVTLQNINSDLADAFHLKHIRGALVADVIKDSPAERAGIEQGDIILDFDGQSVETVASLRNAVSLMKPGTSISLKLQRDDSLKTVRVDLGERPGQSKEKHQKAKHLGLAVEALTPTIAQSLGYYKKEGVVVSHIESGSPSQRAGLRRGHIIVKVNGKSISNPQDFYEAIQETESPLLFLVQHGENARFISIPNEN